MALIYELPLLLAQCLLNQQAYNTGIQTGIHRQQAYTGIQQAYTGNSHTQAYNRQPFNTCLHILHTAYYHTAITHTQS